MDVKYDFAPDQQALAMLHASIREARITALKTVALISESEHLLSVASRLDSPLLNPEPAKNNSETVWSFARAREPKRS